MADVLVVSTNATAWDANRESGLQALRDLRAARRRRYAEQVDWLETFYRLYVAVIFGGWGLALISGALADVRVDRHTVGEIHRYGPAGLGLVVAVAVAGGLRSGGRGGPLVPIILTYMSKLSCFSPFQTKATWLPSGEKLGLS